MSTGDRYTSEEIGRWISQRACRAYFAKERRRMERIGYDKVFDDADDTGPPEAITLYEAALRWDVPAKQLSGMIRPDMNNPFTKIYRRGQRSQGSKPVRTIVPEEFIAWLKVRARNRTQKDMLARVERAERARIRAGL